MFPFQPNRPGALACGSDTLTSSRGKEPEGKRRENPLPTPRPTLPIRPN
jgi:hypothetical protein